MDTSLSGLTISIQTIRESSITHLFQHKQDKTFAPWKHVSCSSHQFSACLCLKMLVLRRKTGGESSCHLVQRVGECGIAETVLGSWVLCSLMAKALELLISLLFASDSESEAINSERQKKEVGRQV